MNKDWTGNYKSIYVTLGASNHSNLEREANDYYATHPSMAKFLLELEPQLNNIWEPACGEGHLAKVFEKNNKLLFASDLIDRGYNSKFCNKDFNFLNMNLKHNGDIVTNPPYKYALEFVKKSLESINENHYVCMFLKLTFLEGKERRNFFKENPPIRIWVSSSRMECAKNGKFLKDNGNGGAVAFGWFVWQKGYKGKTTLDWFN